MPPSLVLSLATRTVGLGEEIAGTVTVSGDDARGLRVALVCAETHRVAVPSDPSGTNTTASTSTAEQVSDIVIDLLPDVTTPVEEENVVEVLAVTQADAPAAGEHAVRMRIPQDAAPSTAGLVRWVLRAFVDGGVSEDADIVVASTPADAAGYDSAPEGDREQLQLSFRGGPPAVRAGETLHGSLTIVAQRSVKLSEVRVEVELTARDRVSYNDIRKIAAVQLVGRTEVDEGTRLELPFSLEIPADLPPTFATTRNAVGYWLKVSAARRLRPDLKTALKVFVASPADG